MGKYDLLVRPSVKKDVKSIPKADLQRINVRISALRNNPRPMGSIKLSGQEYYRIREGDYRIVYEIIDQKLIIVVIKVGHRRDIYR